MERLTVDKTVVRAVEKIPWQRMPDGFHMDADLVCPSCFQEEADEGEVSGLVVGKCPVMGYSGLTPLWIQDPLDGGAVLSCDRKIDGAGCVRLPGDDGGVLPVNRVVLHGIRENAGTVGILCETHKP